jgi:beta-galactosidase
MWNKARDIKATKPFYVSEYAHNMGNAMGNLMDYQEAIESTDVLLGATIWDWVDQCLYMKRYGKVIIGYGGDFGEKPTDGQFSMNGCVLADRTREPSFYEVWHVYQNWTAKATNDFKRVVVRNKNYFRDSKDVECRWTVLLNGESFASGEFDLHALAPQCEHVYEVPGAVALAHDRGGEVSLKVSFVDSTGVVAADQIDFPERKPLEYKPLQEGEIAVREDADTLVLAASSVEYAFSKKTAMLSDIRTGRFFKSAWLKSPMVLDAFRAPSLNEVPMGVSWMKLGLHAFDYEALEIGKVAIAKSVARFRTRLRAVPTNSVTLENYGMNDVKMTDTGKKGEGPSFEISIDWELYPDGTLRCRSSIVPSKENVQLARIGFRFTLDRDNPTVDYYAAGPFENYRDRISGAFAARYRDKARDFHFAYTRPQDSGNRENARAVAFETLFDVLGFAAVGKPFQFAVNPYSPLELVGANHPEQLPEVSKCEFGIFCETRGLGGNSCGPLPLKRDLVVTGKGYELDFAIAPRRLPGKLKMPSEK